MPPRQLQRLRKNTLLPHFVGRRGFSFLGALPPTLVVINGASPAPSPWVHFCTHKSEPKKRQPPSGWTPAFAQSDASKGDTRLPLKYRWILVIGAASYVLRLSALVMRGISVFLSKIYLLPQNPGSSSRKTRWRYPFNRATAEAGRETRRRSDPRRTRWFCGNRVSNFIGTDWTKGGGPGSPRRFFPPFLGGQKWGRRRHAGV